MSRTTEYRILTSYALETLEEVVNEAIREGWETSGGVSVAMCYPPIDPHGNPDSDNERENFYAQAMVRTPPSFGPTPPRVPVPPPTHK